MVSVDLLKLFEIIRKVKRNVDAKMLFKTQLRFTNETTDYLSLRQENICLILLPESGNSGIMNFIMLLN